MTYIGKGVRPIDWEDRTTGRVRYTGDLPAGALFGIVVRSPHPYALIRSIDTTSAAAMPGVRAVITSADFATGILYQHRGAPLSDRPPLAAGVVRHVGQEVAAVAAETLEQALAAARAVKVRYRPRRAPLTIAEALRPGAPTTHERTTGLPNVANRWNSSWGDVAAGHTNGVISVEGDFVYPSVSHACMEPNITLASWHEDTGQLELWTSTQSPFFIVKEVAHLLGLPREQVVCREVAVGGGFGSKSKASEHEVLAAALSRKAGKPVLIAFTRTEEFSANKPRHRFETRLRTTADADGRITLFDAEINVDNGSYNHMGSSVMRVGVITLGSMYRPDGARFDAKLVDTATQPGGQFRGYGTPQVSFAVESQVDELAERLGLDPIEMRLRNMAEDNRTTLCGYEVTTDRLGECLLAVRDHLDWDRLRQDRPAGQGVGVAAGSHGSGAFAYADANRGDAAVDVHADGRVRVRFGGADAGTGQRTILAQIAADELGVALSDVDVLSMDGEKTPYDQGAWSSRGTHMTGFSVGKAAREMAGRLRDLAATKLGDGAIELRDGEAVLSDRSVPIGDLVALAGDAVNGILSHEVSYLVPNTEMLSPGKDTANLSPTYAYAAHGAHVEVDVHTGRVRVLDYVAAHDVGRAINPTMVEGQIVGGAVMGIGAALGEEIIREHGRVVNPAYLNYAMPRAADLPSVRAVIVANHDASGPYGAKSVGEMSIIPPGAAVANAVYDAIGVRIRELPITPEKILAALAPKRNFHLARRPSRWWIEVVRWAYPRGLHHVLHRYGTRVGRRVSAGTLSLTAPTSLSEAHEQVRAGGVPVGGNTDALLASDAVAGAMVSVAAVRTLRDITHLPDGAVRLGAAVTLAELDLHPAINEAVQSIASPQIRAAATVGGNLLQEKRCWFYRNGFPCYKRNGATSPCYAILGDHRFQHAAVDGHRCQAVTPSDLGTVLAAFDAVVELSDGRVTRRLPITDFYVGPGETAIRRGEILTAVEIPAAALARKAVFEKLALWTGDFAIASVTLAHNDDWRDVRVVLGAIAPVPLRLQRVEAALAGLGRVPSAEEAMSLVSAELNRIGHPLPNNVWKLDAASGLAHHAAARLAHD